MKNHKGLTFVGMLFTMAFVILIGIFIMKITPVYIQHYAVIHSLKKATTFTQDELSEDLESNSTLIKRSLMKQLEINGIEDIKEEDILVQTNDGGKTKVTVKYHVVRPLLANISLLFNFEDSQEVDFARP